LPTPVEQGRHVLEHERQERERERQEREKAERRICELEEQLQPEPRSASCYPGSNRMATSILHTAAALAQRELFLRAREPRYAGGVSQADDKLGAIAEAARVFVEDRIPYALIGGLAVGIRSGVPRATLDVDFAIATTVSRTGLIARLNGRGFQFVGEFPHSINFKHSSGEPVQLAFDPAFDEMIARAEILAFGEIELAVVTKDDLIAMKRRSASDPSRRRSKALRDLADIALLEGDVPGPDEGW
jgi:hypothetical protein